MIKILLYCFIIISLSCCVTKAKYNEVLDNIHTREKQREKLEGQLEKINKSNEVLRDSLNKLGG